MYLVPIIPLAVHMAPMIVQPCRSNSSLVQHNHYPSPLSTWVRVLEVEKHKEKTSFWCKHEPEGPVPAKCKKTDVSCGSAPGRNRTRVCVLTQEQRDRGLGNPLEYPPQSFRGRIRRRKYSGSGYAVEVESRQALFDMHLHNAGKVVMFNVWVLTTQ